MIVRDYLQNLQQYVINNDALIIRDSIYEFMIITIIIKYGGDKRQLELTKIIEHVENYFNLSEVYYQINRSINTLLKKNTLMQKTSYYHVVEHAHDEFITQQNKTTQLEIVIKNKINEYLNKKLKYSDAKIIDEITNKLLIILDKIFDEYGSYAARLFSNGDNFEEISKYDGFSKLFRDTMSTTISQNEYDELKTIMHEFLLSPSKELSEYLFSRSISYVIPRVINADPNFKKISEQSFMKKTIVLDTNIIITLLTIDNEVYELTSMLLRNIKKLKMNIEMLEETRDEFIARVEKSKKKWPNNRYKKKQDPFYIAYMKQNNKKITRDDFLENLKQVEYIMNNNYGAKIIDPKIHEHDIPDELCDDIKNATSIKNPKIKTIQYHDAVCLEYVNKKRALVNIDEMGPSCWFLTMDESLKNAVSKYYGKSTMLTISVPALLQIMSPFLTGIFKDNMTKKSFSKLISTNFIVHNNDDKIIDKLLEIIPIQDDLPENIIQKIIGEKIIKKLFDEYEQIEKENNPDKIHDKQLIIKQKFNASISKELSDQRLKINKQHSEINKQHSEIKSLKTKSQEQSKELSKQKSAIIDQKNKSGKLNSQLTDLELHVKNGAKKRYVGYIMMSFIFCIIIGMFINYSFDEYLMWYFWISGISFTSIFGIFISKIYSLNKT